MTRPTSYRVPGALQIYDSTGRLKSQDSWSRTYAPRPEQIARPSAVGDLIAGGLIVGIIGFFVLMAVGAYVGASALIGLIGGAE
jgi:hypothetical protein